MILLLAWAHAAPPCLPAPPSTSPLSISGSVERAGERGVFVQHLDGERFYQHVEAGTYHETDLVLGDTWYHLDSNGRLSLSTSPRSFLLMNSFRPDLSGFTNPNGDCSTLTNSTTGGPRLHLNTEGDLLRRSFPSPCFDTTTTVTSSDFRDVGGQRVPFSLHFAIDENTYASLHVQTVEQSVPDGVFSPLTGKTSPSLFTEPVEVPMTLHNERIYIPVELTGIRDHRSGLMMLDTGWGSTSIDTKVINAIGWERGGWNLAVGATRP